VDSVEKGQPELPSDASADGGERRLRIALLVGSLGPGGAEGVVARLASAWSRRGDTVMVLTLASRADDFFALDPGVRRIALDLAGHSRSPHAAVLANARRISALRATLRDTAPEVLLSFVDRTNLLALVAAAGTRLPVVVCERTDPTRHVLAPPWSLLRRVLYRRAAALAVQHEGLHAWAATLCDPARILVLGNPVEMPASSDPVPVEPKSAGRIVGLGRLSFEKGFDRLIDAFGSVAARLPGWTLVITGDGPERVRLEQLVAAHGLDGRVELRGLATEPWQGTQAGDVFVLPSRYEGMSNALLEAMARGLAPIVTPEAGASLGAGDDGASALVTADGGAAAIAAAIERVATDDHLRDALAAAARRHVARHGVERVAEEWRRAIVGVLALARSRAR
jgi:GalNAc-alpha-(1->4)-GalNAc-alpha-(1->3)-diNAcBac-PP-undecaprenol alpha-1,4-N-acetyl-D-galactosaminyltransferase